MIAIVAAVAAFVLVVLAAVVGTRARSRSDERITRALGEMGERMDALTRDLTRAVEDVRDESRRGRLTSAISTSLDLDEVLQRTADAAATLARAEGAEVVSVSPEGEARHAAAGLPDRAAGRAAAWVGPPGGAAVRGTVIGYVYGTDEAPEGAFHNALAVPLGPPGESGGYVTAYWQAEEPDVDVDEALAELETLARSASPAIENARLYDEASDRATTDGLTGLYNHSTFLEMLRREVDRCHRYDRRLTLLLLDFDNFKAVNDEIGHLAGNRVLVEVADRVREAVRAADIPCRVGGDEFALILPEAERLDAQSLFARILAAVQRTPPEDAEGLTLSGGIAELRPKDDSLGLFERADRALYRAKAAGGATVADDGADL